MESLYGIDIRDISYKKVSKDFFDDPVRKHIKYEKEKKYYKFRAKDSEDRYIEGIIDNQSKLLCSNFGMYQYREALAQEVYDKASQFLSNNEFSVFTDYDYQYMLPYIDSLEEYKSSLENDYWFHTYLFLSKSVSDEKIASTINCIYRDNYPIDIDIFKLDDNYFAPFLKLQMGDYKKDANAIEETLGISWEKEILSLDSGANKEGKRFVSNHSYEYCKMNKDEEMIWPEIRFVIDYETDYEIQLFDGIDSIIAETIRFDSKYVFLKDNNVDEVLKEYKGHNFSIVVDGEAVFTTEINEELLFEKNGLKIDTEVGKLLDGKIKKALQK